MIGFFIAMLSGACMSIQGVFNTQVTKTSGYGWQMLLYKEVLYLFAWRPGCLRIEVLLEVF